jgi:hypothetical protein
MKLNLTHKSFEEKIKSGELKFEYTKKDGSIREAKGTSRLDMIPEGLHPKGGIKATKGTPYFDIEINEWRSITADSLISVDSNSLMEIPGMPLLTEEEIQFMLWNDGDLQDLWLARFINLIVDATQQDASELLNGKFKNLIRVIKKCSDDPLQFAELKERWDKLIN